MNLSQAKILIIVPVFNDWPVVQLLLSALDAGLKAAALKVDVLIVDDGSTAPCMLHAPEHGFDSVSGVNVLELRRNLGHQRAIAVALAYVNDHLGADVVAVMDGDGEDRPEDLVRLLVQCEHTAQDCIVFARRSQRSEGQVFSFFYAVYRSIYKLLTGGEIAIGNFSVMPKRVLKRVVVVSEIWSHYAAGVLKARIPHTEIDTKRGVRLSGNSHMKFASLVTHGLSAISVHADVVGTRLLIAASSLIVLALFAIVVVAGVRVFTDLAIAGWASYMVGLLLVIAMQSTMFLMFIVFLVLDRSKTSTFLPARDYVYFVERLYQVMRR